MKEIAVSFSELNLTVSDIIEEMGYNPTEVDTRISEVVTAMLSLVEKESNPKCCFHLCSGSLNDEKLIIDGIELQIGQTIASLLNNSIQFALFAATAGSGFELLAERMKKESDMLDNYVLDMIGSMLVERVGDRMEKYLEREIGELLHTNRFSPGYCSWHLNEQTKLFALMGGSPCDISLSEVCLMTPMKSISGVIGIGANVSQKIYACHLCELETCYRKNKFKTTN